MARKAGEIRVAVLAAMAELYPLAVAHGRLGVTGREIADHLVGQQVARAATIHTVKHLAREGRFVLKGTVRAETCRKPLNLYAPGVAEPEAGPRPDQALQAALTAAWAPGAACTA